MYHVVFLVKKRPDMTQEDFGRYWLGEHTPLTASVAGVRSYRCYPALPGQDDSPFDGVAVLSFDDKAACDAAMASPAFAAALADAPNFQDTAATASFFADERVVV
ncbi:MAG TPA: EthD family reductase [Thermomicrobiales bacterium]|nr:EthD family reductase [Thermomicrobiales bacterium]